MAHIDPHVNFNGNCEEAFTFYQSVFGGSFSRLMRFKDLPHLDQAVFGAEAEKIMHIALPIGASTLMGNDVPSVLGRVSEEEHRSKITVTAESREEADRLYQGLSEGGAIEMPIGDSPWGSYFAMFRDKYGIEWMVNFEPARS